MPKPKKKPIKKGKRVTITSPKAKAKKAKIARAKRAEAQYGKVDASAKPGRLGIYRKDASAYSASSRAHYEAEITSNDPAFKKVKRAIRRKNLAALYKRGRGKSTKPSRRKN